MHICRWQQGTVCVFTRQQISRLETHLRAATLTVIGQVTVDYEVLLLVSVRGYPACKYSCRNTTSNNHLLCLAFLFTTAMVPVRLF